MRLPRLPAKLGTSPWAISLTSFVATALLIRLDAIQLF